ncbi:MAG TPA: hypothetical protein ACFYD7_12880 [Candidatus Wujingus californicus]|uniref:hypothetical protein n=1 Tax=Candidatus Wujingus californicus TaxID=3367618 RepID=UPI004029FD8C
MKDDNISRYRNVSTWTEEVYLENLRKMGGEKKLKVAFQLYEMAINLCRQNIIKSNPRITETELKQKIFERFGYDTRRFAYKSYR